MWTEERLRDEQVDAQLEHEKRELYYDLKESEFSEQAELYRLARLGLAAEQVVSAWQRNEVSDAKVPLTLLDHPAWEAP